MGNIVPIDAGKKQEIEDIAKDFLGTFGKEFLLAYGVEFVKMKLKQIDEETYGEEERKTQLMYRKKRELKEPHKMGLLTKQGAIVKNWKKRYFVVNPDYSVNYYESEEAHHKGMKPKGVILLAGYQVHEKADDAKIERLKALAKQLGLNEDELPLPDKFPAHTLTLMHERRRVFYITAADEDEKKEWVEMFKTCCQKSSGFKNKDPVAQAAFKTAYRRACREAGWYRYNRDCGGTEEQILSETIAEIVNYRVLSSVYSGLTGNFTIRKKIRDQVQKMLDSLVLALVIPAYKGMVESAQNLKEPLEKTVDEKKEVIVNVQRKVTEQLSDKLKSIVTKVAEEIIVDVKKMFDDLKELGGRTSAEMKKECVVRLMDQLIKKTREDKNAEEAMKKYYKIFDRVCLGLLSWDHWYYVYNIEKEAIGIVEKYEESFDQQTGLYSLVYTSHDFLTEVADAAFFTFEEIFKERTKDTNVIKDSEKAVELMESVKKEVIPKYDADSSWTPQDISFKQTTMVVLEFFSKKINPLTKDILKNVASAIPDGLKEVVSIQDRYELYLEECVKDLIRKAVGITKPKQSDVEGNKKAEVECGKDSQKRQLKEEETGTQEETPKDKRQEEQAPSEHTKAHNQEKGEEQESDEKQEEPMKEESLEEKPVLTEQEKNGENMKEPETEQGPNKVDNKDMSVNCEETKSSEIPETTES